MEEEGLQCSRRAGRAAPLAAASAPAALEGAIMLGRSSTPQWVRWLAVAAQLELPGRRQQEGPMAVGGASCPRSTEAGSSSAEEDGAC